MWRKEQLERVLKAAAEDPGPLMGWGFAIALETGGLGWLALNRPQRKLHAALQGQARAGRPQRAIVLKARQFGISTYGIGRLVASALARPYTMGCLVTHLKESTEKMMGKAQIMLDRLPEGLKPAGPTPRKAEIPLKRIPTMDEEYPLETRIIGGTAGGEEVWRGVTLHTVHCSELASFRKGDDVLLGLLQAVPNLPGTCVMLESTANGVGNTFHREWLRAETGESGFAPVFLGWWDTEKNRLPVPKRGLGRLTSEEKVLQKAPYRCSEEQLLWRRWTIQNQCQGDVDRFNQEHPESPAVAFMVTGQPAFPVLKLRAMWERAQNESRPERGRMEGNTFIATGEGLLAVYRRPEPGKHYTVGGDVAAGVEGGDYSAAQVFCRETEEHVATWHGHISPVGFAHVLEQLGYYYNSAIMTPEVNGQHGFSVVEELRKRGYPAWYVWSKPDKIMNSVTNFIGWETTYRTRGLLFDSMHWALTAGAIMVWDVATIDDMLGCRYTDRNIPEGTGHDDLTMALLIAYRAHLEMPLESTGLPPRVILPGETPRIVEPLPDGALGGAPGSMEIWAEVDKELQQANRAAMGEWESYVGMGEPEQGFPVVPPIPW